MSIRVCKYCNSEANTYEDLVFFVTDSGSKYGKKNLCTTCQKERRTYVKKRASGDYLRKCLYCGVEAKTQEDLCEFVNHKDATHGKRNMCIECKKDKDSSPERRDSTFMRLYGVTAAEYDECMSTSHYCEHCGTDKKLCYDHDHDYRGVEAFRGVLCQACNGAVGILGDTLESINRMSNYLRRYEEKK